MSLATVDVIIPAWHPGKEFHDLLKILTEQTYPISHILIINTEEKYWDNALIKDIPNAEVFHIRKEDFDHAATRNMGAGFSDADYLVYLTQDAMPADRNMLIHLLEEFENPLVKAVYGRQLSRKDCHIPEGFVRTYNYPAETHIRTDKDLEQYGVKTFFCSNVCAAYDHATFRELNGFSAPCIFNEDMVYAGRLIKLGYAVGYAGNAEVYHSHNYSAMQQFHRNFDNGASQAMHPELFQGLPAEGEGKNLVKYVTKRLLGVHCGYLIPGFYWQCFMRYLGFRLGKKYMRLPFWMVRSFTMNREFWDFRKPEEHL